MNKSIEVYDRHFYSQADKSQAIHSRCTVAFIGGNTYQAELMKGDSVPIIHKGPLSLMLNICDIFVSGLYRDGFVAVDSQTQHAPIP